MQQNFGETLDKHGFLVWDLDTLTYEEVANIKLSEHISNVKINRIESFVPDGSSYTEPYIDLRLSIDSANKNLDPYSFLNDDIFRKPLMDYLNKRMNLDPQIDFWFE